MGQQTIAVMLGSLRNSLNDDDTPIVAETGWTSMAAPKNTTSSSDLGALKVRSPWTESDVIAKAFSEFATESCPNELGR
jgi:hypothetical protein